MIKQALISVSDKHGILEFAYGLFSMGVKILSTGGTAKFLMQHGIVVTEIADYTGYIEMLDGRIKTLHPKVYSGILARRDSSEHMLMLEQHGFSTIDIVIVNLYPFQEVTLKSTCTIEIAIENIDVGGPTMLRAAAKNYKDVIVVCDPKDYSKILENLKQYGNVQHAMRLILARKVFNYTAQYDFAVSEFFSQINYNSDCANLSAYPKYLNLCFTKVQDMRYGENPHQSAAFYRNVKNINGLLANYNQLQGKKLSFNNIVDADTAWECVKTFDPQENAACVIVKHANPCGVAIGGNTLESYNKALKTDQMSAFGGIIAFNREVDDITAKNIIVGFVEIIIAPIFSIGARCILKTKSNVRVLVIPFELSKNLYDFKRVGGGLLVQLPDLKNVLPSELKIVSKKQPTKQQLKNMMFAWRTVKFVKSNAIVFWNNGMTLGIGAGQMSRIDAARVALIKANNAGLVLTDSAVASDAFFPFRDGVDIVINAGASCLIQPGGSKRDQEVIATIDQYDVVMVFTNVRHFRH